MLRCGVVHVPMCIVLSLCALSSKRASLHKEAPASVSRDIECYTVLSDALATLSLGPSPLFSLTFPQGEDQKAVPCETHSPMMYSSAHAVHALTTLFLKVYRAPWHDVYQKL